MTTTTQSLDSLILPLHAEAADVRRAACGDARAFERLYRRHVGRIHTLCRRMLGDACADEVTQDVFVRAWERLSSLRGEAAFGTWLYRVAINVILSRRVADGRVAGRFVADGEALAASRPAPPTSPELRLDLEAAIGMLPDGAREVFVLHDIEGHKHREIAPMLGISEGTSKSQLHRARMLLRAYLKGR